MELDPFIPVEVTWPKYNLWGKVIKKVRRIAQQTSMIMWLMGPLAVWVEANAQQNSVAMSGQAIPGNKETTTQEIPTAQEIIEILQNGKEKIKLKFPTYNDTAFQQIVGQISLWTVKPWTLQALAEAFPEDSVEKKQLLNFGEAASIPKPQQVKVKLPPLNESPEAKKIRLEAERMKKIKDETIREFNKEVLKKENWSSLKIGSSNNNNDADATVGRENGWLIISMKQKNGTLAQAVFKKTFLAGKYIVRLEGSAGKHVIYWPKGKEIIIKPGTPTIFELTENKEVYFNTLPDRITPEITISKFTIEEVPDWEIANRN